MQLEDDVLLTSWRPNHSHNKVDLTVLHKQVDLQPKGGQVQHTFGWNLHPGGLAILPCN